MKINDALKTLIKKSGSTQEEIAKSLGLKTQGSISMLLTRANPRIDTLIPLLECLGYEIVLRNKNNDEIIIDK